jgi:hypothetical protein
VQGVGRLSTTEWCPRSLSVSRKQDTRVSSWLRAFLAAEIKPVDTLEMRLVLVPSRLQRLAERRGYFEGEFVGMRAV